MQFQIIAGDGVDSCDACERAYWQCGGVAIVGEGRAHVCETCLARSPVKVVAACYDLLARRRAVFERKQADALVLIAELKSVSADEWQRIATERGIATIAASPTNGPSRQVGTITPTNADDESPF